MGDELLYTLALSYVSGIGNINHRKLVQKFDSAENVWKLSKKDKIQIVGISDKIANDIGNESILSLAKSELEKISKLGVNAYTLKDEKYSRLLRECVDAPAVIFTRGKAELNSGRYVAIVGTRKMTAIGQGFINKLVQDLSSYPITIVSGLAFGVDITAHKVSLENHIPTIGVMAHGLNKIYPKTHHKVGEQMLEEGGLISEFSSFHNPEPQNFLRRNRIIAGISDATIVVESRIAGGAMNTARHANEYNREVFAMPGRVGDEQSAGCHYLIKNHQAFLITEASDVLKYLGLKEKKRKNQQKELFVELSDSERVIFDCLKDRNGVHIDEISAITGLPSFKIMPILLDLELRNLIKPLPGKKYELQ